MRIVVDVRNGIFRDAVVRTLRDLSSDFEVHACESPAGPTALCAVTSADVLLTEGVGYSGLKSEERTVVRNQVKPDTPACKVVLIADENSGRKRTERVREAKKDGSIDRFVYASVSAAYLSAAIDTL